MVRINLIIFGLFMTFNLFGQYPRIILKQLQKADSSGQFIIADSDSNAVWSDALYITTDSLLTLYGDTIQGGVNYEKIQDTIAAMLEAGLGIQMTYNDADGEFLIESLSIEDSIYNGSGSLISKGTPLYAVGTQGNYWNVAPADASDITKLPAVVIAGEDIGIGETGVGLLKGHIKQVNTTGLADGDEVYVGVGGGYTNVKPKGESNYVQRLGTVIKGNDANGSGIINLGEVQSVSNLNAGNIFIGDTDSTITTTVYIVDSSRVNATGDSLIYYQNGIQVGADKLEGGVFVDDGTYVYYNGGKNVGIGTTTPFRELHIQNSENNKTVFLIENTQNNPFSTAEIGMLQGSSFFNLVNYSDSASATVSGLSLANKGLLQTSNGMDGIVYAPINGQNYFLYDSRFDSDLLYIDATNDRIGIKDTTPTATLDVTGWVNITDSLVVNDIRVTGSGGGTINGVTTDATLTGDGTSGTPLSVVDDGHNHIISNVDNLQTTLDGKQAQLNGTGFVKATGTTISYDNSTYLTTEVDGSISNEGSLTVGAGGANDAVISSNTSGSSDVTISGGTNVTVTESGQTITIASSGGAIPVDTFVTIAGTETITGAKTFTSTTTVDANLVMSEENASVTGQTDGTIRRLSVDGVVDELLYYRNRNSAVIDSISILSGWKGLAGSFTNMYAGKDTTLVIDGTNNRVGIGTTTPSFGLEVNGFGANGILSIFRNGVNGGGAATLLYNYSDGKTSGDGIVFPFNMYNTNNAVVNYASIVGQINSPTASSHSGNLLFNTSNSGVSNERMRITSSGNVGIGTSSPSYPLEMGSGAHVTTGGVWTDASDIKLKTNINYIYPYGLEDIMNLKPTIFDYKNGEKNSLGFIAQDIYEIIPEAISSTIDDNGNETMGVKMVSITATLTKAIQEQQAIIETQATEIEQLKTLITELSNRLTILENN